MIEKEKILEIKKFAKQARKNILDMSLSAGASSSHFGGSLSTVEIISTLYNSVFNFNAANPCGKIEIDLFWVKGMPA